VIIPNLRYIVRRRTVQYILDTGIVGPEDLVSGPPTGSSSSWVKLVLYFGA
jgi:hypothetical protein